MTKREQNKLDRVIEEIVRRRCSGMPISVMDIGKVFRAGYAAHTNAGDVEVAVVTTYTELSHA
jgi:hypothetical protein